MKSKIILILVGVCFLSACTKEYIISEPIKESSYEVRFRIEPAPEISAFHSTKSIPEKFPPEPVALRSDDTEEENDDLSFSFIEYAVFDAEEDTLVHHIRFSKDDKTLDDFGVFIYDTLKTGNYKVCVLTHSIAEASLSNNIFSFPNINDTFYGNENVSINVSTVGQEKEILLKRVVSRVEFVSTDMVPEKVKTFHLAVSERFNKINLFTGKAEEEKDQHELEHIFTDEERGENIFNTHAFYTFVPSTENMKLPQVTLISKDKEQKDVRKRIIKDIPIVANKITRYKGILYTPGIFDDRFDLSFENDGKWNDSIEENLPDD